MLVSSLTRTFSRRLVLLNAANVRGYQYNKPRINEAPEGGSTMRPRGDDVPAREDPQDTNFTAGLDIEHGTGTRIEMLQKPLAFKVNPSWEEEPVPGRYESEDLAPGDRVTFAGLSPLGFYVDPGYMIYGPIVAFRNNYLEWNIDHDPAKLSVDAFKIFEVLLPKIELVLVGLGTESYFPELDNVRNYLSTLGINLEVSSAEAACASFNFLNSDDRHVAACLLPPAKPIADFQSDLTETVIPQSNPSLIREGTHIDHTLDHKDAFSDLPYNAGEINRKPHYDVQQHSFFGPNRVTRTSSTNKNRPNRDLSGSTKPHED